MSSKLLFFTIFLVTNTANRLLLQGGGGGGGSDFGGGGFDGGYGGGYAGGYDGGFDGVGGYGDGGGYGGGDSGGNSEPSTWSYYVYINMTYEWNIRVNPDLPSSFSYKTIWTDTKPFIKDSSNKYKIKKLYDRTGDKSHIMYNQTTQMSYEETHFTEWRELKLSITTEYKRKLTNYLKSNEFKSTLLNKINQDSTGKGLQFTAIYVTVKKIPNYLAIYVTIYGCIFGVVVLCYCGVWCYQKSIKSKYLKRLWAKKSTTWVNNNGIFGKNHEGESNPFIDGMYVGHYYQYGRSHPMHEFKLIFDGDNGVTGYGTDTVGDYNINGIYSVCTARMQLNKKYVADTGDRYENLGHTVKIRLEWNRTKQQFKGPWYVKTYKYEGTGTWIITRRGIKVQFFSQKLQFNVTF